MSRHPELYQWIDTVVMRFPSLSKPQALGLALWSFGMVIARSCSLTAVADMLAPLMGQSYNTVRERLRDTYREAGAKAGEQRVELDVTECWAPWLAWLLDGWSGQQMAIAMDATSLGDRFVVLAISVVYRGCAVPVAWKVLKAEEKHAWKPEWQALLKRFHGLVPKGWTVIVLADRGLYGKWLFEAIVELNWHPFLRVNTGGWFRPDNWFHWQPFSRLVPDKGCRWQGRGTAFKGKKSQLRCTLLGYWGEEHQELWMAIAIATWWLLSVGGEAEAQADEPLNIKEPSVPGAVRRRGKRWRIVGIFLHGWSLIIASLLNHQLLPVKPGRPEAWPRMPDSYKKSLAACWVGSGE